MDTQKVEEEENTQITESFDMDLGWTDAVIDLETLGTSGTPAILSIGAQMVNRKGELGSTFYAMLSLKDSLRLGFDTDADTIKWWMLSDKVSDSARLSAFSGELSVLAALNAFDSWILANSVKDENGNCDICVWGNGSDFDNSILRNAYARIGRDIPWKFWKSRCFRTIRDTADFRDAESSSPAELPQGLVQHNAVDDAIRQANVLANYFRSKLDPKLDNS